MKNRIPAPPEDRPTPAAFAPVPRLRDRHDGWTPERQRAFVAALADCGSVRTAANMVNMSSESAYALRRHPAAAGFRAAWHAALGMGVLRLKDEAFDRAINGELVPVFSGGKLMGFRRKKNDRLLMQILRHYGPTPEDRRHTIRHITAQATAAVAVTHDAPEAEPLCSRLPDHQQPAATHSLTASDRHPAPATTSAAAQATITAATPPTPDDDEAHAATLAAFAGVALDATAQAQVLAALAANAVRAQALAPEDDPEIPYLPLDDAGGDAALLLEGGTEYEPAPFTPGEPAWHLLADPAGLDAIDAAQQRVAAAMTNGDWEREGVKQAAEAARKAARDKRLEGRSWEDYVED